jgi:hypothetical protein
MEMYVYIIYLIYDTQQDTYYEDTNRSDIMKMEASGSCEILVAV